MNFEDLQKAWQSQNAGGRVTINADLLMKEVRRNQRHFWRTIFWRDVREVGASILTTVCFLYSGIHSHSWSLYLMSFCCFFVGAFFLVDRRVQRRKQTTANDPLKACIEASLNEVNHQIWLLKNIFWWYLLPFIIGFGAFFAWMFGQMSWARRADGLAAMIVTGVVVTITFAFSFRFVYRINQRAVTKQLTPRRQELEALLAETGNPVSSTDIKNKTMKMTILLTILLTAIFAIGVILAAVPSSSTSAPSAGDTTQTLEGIRKMHDLPALAVVVVKDGQICDRAAVGLRKQGDPTPVTTNDLFHIGSCTKSMTATLTAILIEDGKLRWDTTIADVFPELKGRMDKQYEAVTVEQLLTHRGGVPGKPPDAAWKRAWEQQGTPTQQRREFIEAVLVQPPEAAPGTKMIYSNQGYAIVGAMLEKLTGTPWETLITERLFKPLHMDTAGFGPPGTTGKVDQPWGHTRKPLMTVPIQADNPPAIAPAGRVHCSLDDLARFTIFHMQRGATGGLLKPETLAKLHTAPEGGDYACGWVVLQRGWAGGTALMHNGSNTMWYVVMWLAPEKDFSVIVATNVAGPDAEKGCDEAASAMIRQWLTK
jgi:CubicO group peptidase (beta-lactamase class C family)